ncbi:MAG: hypothetical protein AAGA56_27620 [Myxococcota bacterium]
MASLKSLTALEELWLSAPRLETLAPLGSLVGLTYLGLGDGLGHKADLHAELARLGGRLPRLKNLAVFDSPHNTSYLRDFPRVEWLAISARGTRAFDLRGVALLPQLADLEVHGGEVKHLASLGRARSLKSVMIESNVAVSPREVEALRRARPKLLISRKPPPSFDDVPLDDLDDDDDDDDF